MNELDRVAAEIKFKVIGLIEKLNALEKRSNLLEQENLELQRELLIQKNSTKALEETNKLLKIAETLNNAPDKLELKKLVQTYLNDIDECLRLLSNK